MKKLIVILLMGALGLNAQTITTTYITNATTGTGTTATDFIYILQGGQLKKIYVGNLSGMNGNGLQDATVNWRHIDSATKQIIGSSTSNSVSGSVVRQGISPTPPMGFNTWYINGTVGINEALLIGIADYLYTNGFSKVGYDIVWCDDGWTYPYGNPLGRDNNNAINANPTNFPNGMKYIADYCHARGLKLGIYTEDTYKAVGDFIGSKDHFIEDCAKFASWGIDAVKFDVYAADYRGSISQFSQALDATGRPMFLYTGIYNQPDPWVLNFLNSARWTGDVLGNVDVNGDGTFDVTGGYPNLCSAFLRASAVAPYMVKADRFVDYDVLPWYRGLGPGVVHAPTLRTAVAMNSILTAPLIMAAFTTDATGRSIMTNTEVIAINKDVLLKPATCIATNGTATFVWGGGAQYTWVKQLEKLGGRTKAVALMNADTNASASMTITLTQLGFNPGYAFVRDCWAKTSSIMQDSMTVSVPAGDCYIYKITYYGDKVEATRSNGFVPINTTNGWPPFPPGDGSAYIGNSNGVIYALTAPVGQANWTITKIAP